MSKLIVKDLEGPASTSNKIYIASGSQLDIAGSPGGAAAINLAVDGADITTGTLSNARLAAGNVIQAVTATLTTAESWAYNGAEAWSAIGTSGCEVSITPSVASSKILIIYSIGGISSYNGNTPVTRILRSISGGTATAPLVATGASNRAEGQTIAPGYVGGTQASGEIAWDTGSHFIDSPNTTSAITYAIQWHGRATSTFTNYVNRAYNDTDGDYVGRGVTVITAMEIKA
jgi:hypothetical protein